MPNYSRDEIIQAAKKTAAQINGPLSLTVFKRLSKINEHDIRRAFPEGRWSEVQRLAGLEPHHRQYTRDEIIKTAKQIAAKVDNVLSRSDFMRRSGISGWNITRVFPEGGWSEVKRLAGLERHPKYYVRRSDDDLLQKFHKVASEAGQIPTWAVFSARANVSESTMPNRFGGSQAALNRYQKWLEKHEPTSPLRVQLREKLRHKATTPKLPSSKTLGAKSAQSRSESSYVDSDRLSELRAIKSEKFDLEKLVRLCEELNKCYIDGSYFAVAMLVRAILDHVPPVFECKSFTQVASNYPEATRSFKQSMENLENSSRKIADAHLHSQIRKKEVLPNKTQVNFASDLDVLLAEIVRALK